MADTRFLISFDTARGPLAEADLAKLRALCQRLDTSMRDMGVLVCDAPASALPSLQSIRGVTGVEVEGTISIRPPGGEGPQ